MAARWRIDLLGGLRVEGHGQVITRFRTRKTGVLLAYLACYLQRAHPRDHLIELLWPETDPDAGSNSLSQALSSLRRQLEPSGVPSGTVLAANRATIRLNPDAVTTDLIEFEAVLHAAASAAGRAERRSLLTRAVELYRGELLAGDCEAWVLELRGWVAESYFQALGELLVLLQEEGDLPRALEYARQGVLADPLREEARCDLMRLYAAVGQPAAALRQYRELERLVQQELKTELSAATRALAREIEQTGGSRPVTWGAGSSVPVPLTRFFGRDDELAQLRALLLEERRRLVTLTGPGGSGKTRLALEAAQRLRAPFRDAVWFVPLVDLTGARRIAERVRDALGLPRSPHVEPLDQVLEALSRQRSLLVLDNFEHLLEQRAAPDGHIAQEDGGGAALVRRLLEQTPALSVIVTSRQRLGVEGERELMVPPLPIPAPGPPRPDGRGEDVSLPTGTEFWRRVAPCPSVQLFTDRAQGAQPDFQLTEANADAVAVLCARLEGLPLALELAAARAAVLTPAQMLARLEQRFELLANPGQPADVRHRSLWATLDWSYQLLSPPLQRFFAQLSVFRGGWTLEAAEAVCDEPQALDFLTRLRQSSLVQAAEQGGAMRYRLLETLREYGAEQLDREERASLARRHARYFLQLAEAAAPCLWGVDEVAWLDRLERELDNIRAALDWGQATEGETETGLRLAGALDRFWDARCYWTEGRERLEGLLAVVGPEGDPAARARALAAAAYLACLQRDLARAAVLGEESLMLSRQRDDKVGILRALLHLQWIVWYQGDLAGALRLGEEGLALARELGSRYGIARSLGFLGSALRRAGDIEGGVRRYQECLAVFRELGSQSGIAIALLGLMWVAWDQGDDERVAALGEESLTLFRAVGDPHGMARVLALLASAALRQGAYERAAALCEEALAHARELGDPEFIAALLNSRGCVAQSQGDDDLALSLHRESGAIYRRLQIPSGIALCLEGLGRIAARHSQLERAARWFAVAAGLRQAHGAPVPPGDRAAYEALLAALRQSLGEAAFTTVWAAGQAQSWEQALADAIGEAPEF